MSKPRIAMRRIRAILRLHFECKLSNQQIASALKISKGSVAGTLAGFGASEFDWPLDVSLGDSQIEECLRRPPVVNAGDAGPDYALIDAELPRPYVTLQSLFEVYQTACPSGVSPACFYRGYCVWRSARDLPMKLIMKATSPLSITAATAWRM